MPAFTDDDLQAALRVLGAVAEDRAALAHVDADARVTLQRLAGEVARPDLKQRKKLQRELLRQELAERKAHDEALRAQTGIRELRRAPVFVTPPREARLMPPSGAAQLTAEAGAAPLEEARVVDEGPSVGPKLHDARKCYVCKASYTTLHPFYDQLCPSCGDLNQAKRTQAVDLRGRVAVVTGARVKIGYQAAILLLRSGCTVVACTRFPHDAAQRYAREPDFAEWKDRLHVYGIDLRHTPSVELLAQHLAQALPRLDFQIHNACQTVRRPPGFYAHLVDGEQAPVSSLSPDVRPLVEPWEELKLRARAEARAQGLASPALLTQAASEADLLLSSTNAAVELFPRGVLDQDLQQVDLRAHNSWRLTLGEVPTLELLEVLLVNAAAPFVMASKLKHAMLRVRQAPPGTTTSHDDAKHIVMVSAMEGQFYRDHKTDKHPHTNMAKAALNMIVRTSAADYAKDGIFLNAVDTGWVTDEDPAHLAAKKVEEHRFSPPLDIVDGAARIVDPILSGFATGTHPSGYFLKDYKPTPW